MNALASRSESGRKIALDRFRLLQPHLEERRLLKAVARAAGIGYRTVQRWKMRYRKYGLAGLARDDRSEACRLLETASQSSNRKFPASAK
jgi:putative transposase